MTVAWPRTSWRRFIHLRSSGSTLARTVTGKWVSSRTIYASSPRRSPRKPGLIPKPLQRRIPALAAFPNDASGHLSGEHHHARQRDDGARRTRQTRGEAAEPAGRGFRAGGDPSRAGGKTGRAKNKAGDRYPLFVIPHA